MPRRVGRPRKVGRPKKVGGARKRKRTTKRKVGGARRKVGRPRIHRRRMRGGANPTVVESNLNKGVISRPITQVIPALPASAVAAPPKKAGLLSRIHHFIKSNKILSKGASALGSVLPGHYGIIANGVGSALNHFGYGHRRRLRRRRR